MKRSSSQWHPAAAGFAILFAGCASLTPYSEIEAGLAPEDKLEIDGQTVHVEDRGSGPPIVSLHGFGASTYEFRRIVPRLEDSFRLVAVDSSGFGFTERPLQAEGYTAEAQTDLVLSVMDRLGIDSAHFLGHSYGGALALRIAGQSPGRVRKLVLVSPLTGSQEPPRLFRSEAGRRVAYGAAHSLISIRPALRLALRRAYHRRSALTPSVVRAYQERLLVEGLKPAVLGFTKIAAETGAFSVPLEQIGAETLVIAGRHDRIVPAEESRQAAEWLPRGEFRLLEDSGHSALEEQPEAVASAVERFLRGR